MTRCSACRGMLRASAASSSSPSSSSPSSPSPSPSPSLSPSSSMLRVGGWASPSPSPSPSRFRVAAWASSAPSAVGSSATPLMGAKFAVGPGAPAKMSPSDRVRTGRGLTPAARGSTAGAPAASASATGCRKMPRKSRSRIQGTPCAPLSGLRRECGAAAALSCRDAVALSKNRPCQSAASAMLMLAPRGACAAPPPPAPETLELWNGEDMERWRRRALGSLGGLLVTSLNPDG
mmetsp:Transcript_37997/g.119268  ORF Transcript_37997/g.119268 Transcript_37997/m.119268 type:complete len:234 (-) Transcript_37997:3100-3801(-)